MRDPLAVDLDLHRIEAKGLPFRERNEDGDLGVGRIEQLLLEATELRSDAEDVRFDLLNLLVQALYLLLRDWFCFGRSTVDATQQDACDNAEDPATERDRGTLLSVLARVVRRRRRLATSQPCLHEGGCHESRSPEVFS